MTSQETTPHVRVLAVVGPTASGKTALAEALAVRLGGEIVSADSMQIYRGMDIGTAKLPADQRQVPHWCIDLADPGESYSAALYQVEARGAIDDIASRGLLPVVCGGTGLYVRSALDPLEFPAGEQAENTVRAQYEAYADKHGPEALYELLVERDPESAAVVHRNNTRRVIRALEMLDEGVQYATQRRGFSARQSVYDASFVGLNVDRKALYARIDARVDSMIDAGLVDEVRGLLDAGLRDAMTASQAIGYKELVPVIESGASLQAAVESIKQATRRYAKRQLTWFRSDPRIQWVDVTELSTQEVLEAALGTLDW